MTQVFGDDDADLALVQDRNVAVLGYDGEARAHALCLRDSGVDVRVGLEAGSDAAHKAVDDGLRVVSAYEACEEADLFVLLGLQPDDPVWRDVVSPNLVPGDVAVLGAASVMAAFPDGVDVVRVMPWSDGDAVRRHYRQGRGVAMFLSVVTDASGKAFEVGLAYARAIGGTRAGVLATGDDEYSATLEHSRALMYDDLLRHLRLAFDEAVEEGSSPEVAYVLCIQALEPFARAVTSGRLDGVLGSLGIRPEESGDVDALAAAAAVVRDLTGGEGGRSRGLD
jgi:ketol-acid reductoisomerase